MLCSDYTQLDNPIYAALNGPHARFALSHGRAYRYDPEVAPFFALPPDPSPRDWADAIELIPAGTAAAVLQPEADIPAPWLTVGAYSVVQMVGDQVTGADDPDAITLGPDDVPEMLELVRATEPGPFLPRTIELGRYVGFREHGRLVAMAGERIRLDGWTEVSAVCTAATHRGRGLASRLMSTVTSGILERSERPFLHVIDTNTSAIRLYEQLGFRTRLSASITLVMASPP
jgi:ribosomal protein S18 acetylase RimI-like enzyme